MVEKGPKRWLDRRKGDYVGDLVNKWLAAFLALSKAKKFGFLALAKRDRASPLMRRAKGAEHPPGA